MDLDCDFLVIGAGISGAAAAYELAAHGSVAVLEAESRFLVVDRKGPGTNLEEAAIDEIRLDLL